jgi:hypothetical protein
LQRPADERDRYAGGGQRGDQRVPAAAVDEQDTVDVAAAQVPLQRDRPFTGGQQHRHVVLGERGTGAGQYPRIERVGEQPGVGFADHGGHRTGAPVLAVHARRALAHVPEFVDRFAYLLTGGRADSRGSVEDPGRGCWGDARERGDVGEGGMFRKRADRQARDRLGGDRLGRGQRGRGGRLGQSDRHLILPIRYHREASIWERFQAEASYAVSGMSTADCDEVSQSKWWAFFD